MKKLMLILFVVAASVSTTFGQSTIAYVNTQAVLDTMPSRKKAMDEINNFQEKALNELKETQKDLQEDYAKLQNEKENMSPTAFKFEQERLLKKSQDFQMRQQQLDQQIQTLSQELNKPILDRVQKAVNTVCKKMDIDYAIDQTALLYSGGGKDITSEVIKEVLRLEKAAQTSTEKK